MDTLFRIIELGGGEPITFYLFITGEFQDVHMSIRPGLGAVRALDRDWVRYEH